MGTTTSRPQGEITTRVGGMGGSWGSAGGLTGRDSNILEKRERERLFLEKDYGNFHCQPWPECFKGDFLGKLGLEGKEARKGQKQR